MKELFPFYSIGHFINQPTNPTEFEITSFEEMEEPNVNDIHKHCFYEIIWIDKGRSRQTIDYKEYEILPQCLFFISPGQVHEFEEWKPVKGGSIMFTEDFFLIDRQNKDKLFELSFLDNFYGNPCIKLGKKDFDEVRRTIDLIYTEQKRDDKSKTIAQSLLHILLAQVQRCIDTKKITPGSKKNLIIYKRFKSLLDTHFTQHTTTRYYADKLNITPHHLNATIKGLTGQTATEAIRSRSMLEAKRLLTFSDQSISEIAANLNYF